MGLLNIGLVNRYQCVNVCKMTSFQTNGLFKLNSKTSMRTKEQRNQNNSIKFNPNSLTKTLYSSMSVSKCLVKLMR